MGERPVAGSVGGSANLGGWDRPAPKRLSLSAEAKGGEKHTDGSTQQNPLPTTAWPRRSAPVLKPHPRLILSLPSVAPLLAAPFALHAIGCAEWDEIQQQEKDC